MKELNRGAEAPLSIQRLIDAVSARLAGRPKLARMFELCFTNTLETTVTRLPDQTTFVITGDIPAMWLRDSAAQVRPYLIPAATDADLAEMIGGVVRRQAQYILRDAYANAFNQTPSGRGHHDDLTAMSDWVWERKYELDSLCYPIQLAYLLWRATGNTDHLDRTFQRAAQRVLEIWSCEQDHEAHSPYRFERLTTNPRETLARAGKGSLVAKTGMTWSGFRPSDDACTYGYLIPANMFAVVVLGYLAEIARDVWGDVEMEAEARRLAGETDAGIQAHGTVEHPSYGAIYTYEADGLGHHALMDDANVPSLLSIPYLGYRGADDPLYQNTRRFILSRGNPYFFEGSAAVGIGSPHTPHRYIWPLALAMQGLTATDPAERERMLELLERTDAGTQYMHESFFADNPGRFTRSWFAWANALFSELVLAYCGYTVPGSPL